MHGGRQAAHVQYAGDQDWSFPQDEQLQVQPGDILELSGWLQTRGEGRVTLSVILYDSDNTVPVVVVRRQQRQPGRNSGAKCGPGL